MSGPKPIFDVWTYDLATLIKLTADLSGANTEAAISQKSHPAYLDSYFKALGVRTIVVERPYVDRDYLEDFAAYYVTCFKDYERHCARMHFFSNTFDKAAFEALLLGDSTKLSAQTLQQAYCGFIVIKPLPLTVFGRTCLKTYPKTDRRDFSVARTFNANLFGINLKVAETLPFQPLLNSEWVMRPEWRGFPGSPQCRSRPTARRFLQPGQAVGRAQRAPVDPPGKPSQYGTAHLVLRYHFRSQQADRSQWSQRRSSSRHWASAAPGSSRE